MHTGSSAFLERAAWGAVYEVEHEQLGVRYVLKAFSTQNKYADVLKKKFLAEGKVLARLHDPHLIRVFDVAIDEATDVPYFVMAALVMGAAIFCCPNCRAFTLVASSCEGVGDHLSKMPSCWGLFCL